MWTTLADMVDFLGIYRLADGEEERRRAMYRASIRYPFIEGMLTWTCRINLDT